MERFRMLIMQIISSVVVGFLAGLACYLVAMNTGFFEKIYNYGFNYKFVEALAIGIALAHLCVLAMKLILWFFKEPIIKEEWLGMGTVKNIPAGR